MRLQPLWEARGSRLTEHLGPFRFFTHVHRVRVRKDWTNSLNLNLKTSFCFTASFTELLAEQLCYAFKFHCKFCKLHAELGNDTRMRFVSFNLFVWCALPHNVYMIEMTNFVEQLICPYMDFLSEWRGKPWAQAFFSKYTSVVHASIVLEVCL